MKISRDKIRALNTMRSNQQPFKVYRLRYDLPFEPEPNKIQVKVKADFIKLIVMVRFMGRVSRDLVGVV